MENKLNFGQYRFIKQLKYKIQTFSKNTLNNKEMFLIYVDKVLQFWILKVKLN